MTNYFEFKETISVTSEKKLRTKQYTFNIGSLWTSRELKNKLGYLGIDSTHIDPHIKLISVKRNFTYKRLGSRYYLGHKVFIWNNQSNHIIEFNKVNNGRIR